MPDVDDLLFDDLDDVTCPEYSDFELFEEDLYTEEELTERAEAKERDEAARKAVTETEGAERMQTREASKKTTRRPQATSPAGQDEGPSDSFAFGQTAQRTAIQDTDMAEADQPSSSETAEQTMARQSREVARRLAEQQTATEREQTPPQTQTAAPPARVARAMETLWTAATDGSENMSGRTPIVLRSGVPHYTTSETVDPGREAQWVQRGMAPLPLTPEQKADMIRLRTATVEFAHFTANASYIPPGYTIDDLLRLYMARAPPILEDSSLHTRMMTGELLALKGKLNAEISSQMAQVQARLDGVEHHVRQQRRRMESTEVQVSQHQAQWDNWAAEEPWLEENTTEPTEFDTTTATQQQSVHTGQVPAEQPPAPANGQAQAPSPQAPAPAPAAAEQVPVGAVQAPAEAPGFEGIPHIAGHLEGAHGPQPA